ncbi:methyl-accepting chemotaxis protein [Terasakiella pusilla]|uniref:methyl-accepting chemotaxis protein n=1 Tax=Terasakiella pusilla TaxID=64973 RepID=UPI003AA9B6A6
MKRLAIKLPILMALMAVFSALSAGGIVTYELWISQKQAISSKLLALTDARYQAIEQYLHSIEEDITFEADSPVTYEGISAFSAAWDALGERKGERLHDLYITNSKYPIGEKHLLDDAGDGSEWSKVHHHYHPHFREFLELRGYYDIFLVRPDGELVYSVFKELDFATNLISGEWASSDLGQIFQDALASPGAHDIVFKDFKPYGPSADAPASFIARKIYDEAKELVGVLVFQMPVGRINSLMNVSVGMGESGETYLVGSDRLMRSDSRFSEESTILKTEVTQDAVSAALNGQTGIHEILDYRGVPVISAYKPLDFNGARWVVLGEMDMAEAMAPVYSAITISAFALLVLIAVCVAASVFFARSLTVPISKLVDNLSSLANGQLDIQVSGTERPDEIGDIAKTTDGFKNQLARVKQLEDETKRATERNETEKRRSLVELAAKFEEQIGSIVQNVAVSSNQLETNAQSLTVMMQDTNTRSVSVSATSEQASGNVEAVAAACEEMAASIREISGQVQTASEATAHAAESANATRNTASGLADSVQEITNVVQLIQDIAAQTNLLALNATIEAARAGEAGKGFAVVAQEVKNLANQTARATEDISAQIEKVEATTQAMVNAVNDISDVISKSEESSHAISAAIEQQDNTTNEITQNIAQAAAGTSKVASEVALVTQTAAEGSSAASQVLSNAQNLAHSAYDLRSRVDDFLKSLRAS